MPEVRISRHAANARHLSSRAAPAAGPSFRGAPVVSGDEESASVCPSAFVIPRSSGRVGRRGIRQRLSVGVCHSEELRPRRATRNPPASARVIPRSPGRRPVIPRSAGRVGRRGIRRRRRGDCGFLGRRRDRALGMTGLASFRGARAAGPSFRGAPVASGDEESAGVGACHSEEPRSRRATRNPPASARRLRIPRATARPRPRNDRARVIPSPAPAISRSVEQETGDSFKMSAGAGKLGRPSVGAFEPASEFGLRGLEISVLVSARCEQQRGHPD